MTRIEQEKRIVRKMIELYCRHHLHQDTMPDEYLHLADFACRRLDHCTYGEQKTACKDCPTHCYAPKEREAIREVMRWAGPRMIWYAPKDAFIHFFHIVKHWLQWTILFGLAKTCQYGGLTILGVEGYKRLKNKLKKKKE